MRISLSFKQSRRTGLILETVGYIFFVFYFLAYASWSVGIAFPETSLQTYFMGLSMIFLAISRSFMDISESPKRYIFNFAAFLILISSVVLSIFV
jgi:hypothetical protein